MGLSFDEVQRAILARTPLGTRSPGKRRMTEKVLHIALAANWLGEMGLDVTGASVADRLAALDLLSCTGNQVIGDILGQHGLKFESRKAKGKRVYVLPPGGITKALLEEHFDCRDWHWDADEAAEPELSDGVDRDDDEEEPELSDGPVEDRDRDPGGKPDDRAFAREG
jgi:hypothetical protein